MKNKLLVIVGATAVGKTSLSIELAKKFNGEIISADSIQIYKGLDIGSAKVRKDEMQNVEHHLIDILEPTESFNASDYAARAKTEIENIIKKGKRPIVVGGTGLWVNSLLFGFSVGVSKDEEYRKSLEKYDSVTLHKQLEEIDPESAKLIHENHKSRIIRALEIYHLSGKKKSDFKQNEQSDYDYLLLHLCLPREELYKKINERVDLMLKNGLIKEVENLLDSGVKKSDQSMQAIGYKETIAYLEKTQNEQDFVEKLKQNSRNYAKRQETYFKKMKNAVQVDVKNKDFIFKIVEDFYGRKC